MKTVKAQQNGKQMGAEERHIMKAVTGEQEPLPYDTITKTQDGTSYKYKQYVIPDEDKEKIIRKLWLFDDAHLLKMDDVYLDIHCNKTFNLIDAIITRENDCNFIMSPYYNEAGGTLLDMTLVANVKKSQDEGQPCVVICNSFKKTGE